MAKKIGPKEAALRQAREGKAAPDTATLFDATAYEKELEALKEKHLGGLRSAIDAAKLERDEAEQKLTGLQRQLDKVLGRSTAAVPAGGGKRTRLTKEQIAELETQALAFISGGGKEGVSRGAVAEHLGIETAKAATVLTALKEAKKAEPRGQKAASRWFPL